MTRLVTFAVVLIAIIVASNLETFKSEKVSNARFDLKKQELAHANHLQTLKELEEKKYIKVQGRMWSMTEEGYQFAGNLYNQHVENE